MTMKHRTIPDLGLNAGYIKGFYHQLTSQLRALGLEVPSTVGVHQLDLCHLFEAELLLLQNMPDERLAAYSEGLAYRSEAARGVAMPSPSVDAPPSAMRQHLIECLSEMYRELQSRRSKDFSLSMHVRHVSHIAIGSLIVLFIILYIGHVVPREMSIPPLAFILAAGGYGAILGYIRDILKPRGKYDLTMLTFELESTRHYWIYRLAGGLLYSLVVTLIAISGVLQNALMPSLPTEGESGLMIVFMNTGMSTVEYSKLLIWCFVAGWWQPFVPGVLDRLAAKATDPDKASGSK